MMGALQVQRRSNNGDGAAAAAAADELFPDPGYVEVDPTGRYGRVRSIIFISLLLFFLPPSLLVFVFVFFLCRRAPSCRGTNNSSFPPLLCSDHRLTAVRRDSWQGILKDCVRSSPSSSSSILTVTTVVVDHC